MHDGKEIAIKILSKASGQGLEEFMNEVVVISKLQHQLEDYQINVNSILIYCDNTAAICLSKNPILHSRAKHIEIKHHFIRDYVQKGILDIQFIDTEWADIFTKPLTLERFDFIKKNLNMHFVSN